MSRRRAVPVLLVAALAAPVAAHATTKLPTGPTAREVTGPLGVRLLAPARTQACRTSGVAIPVRARWSRRALDRPVRAIRVLLQRPGSEAVIDSAVLAPARPGRARSAVLRTSACRANLDVRYELFLGRDDRAHDHTSVVFRVHAPAAR